MAAAEQWEPDDARVSCPVLRERGGAIPRATHLVVGFEHEADARRFWEAMRERLEEFSLSLHPDKTRLIEFGRFAAANRKQRGLGKPETFTFLGFTFICGRSRRGDFLIQRKTRRDRMPAKLRRSRRNCDGGCTSPFPEQGQWLRQVLTGYYDYHAVPTNSRPWRPSGTMSSASGDARSATQPEGRNDLGADHQDRQRLTPQTAHPSSLATPTLRRQTPEVGAGVPEWGTLGSVRGARSNCRPLYVARCPAGDHIRWTARKAVSLRRPFGEQPVR